MIFISIFNEVPKFVEWFWFSQIGIVKWPSFWDKVCCCLIEVCGLWTAKTSFKISAWFSTEVQLAQAEKPLQYILHQKIHLNSPEIFRKSSCPFIAWFHLVYKCRVTSCPISFRLFFSGLNIGRWLANT